MHTTQGRRKDIQVIQQSSFRCPQYPQYLDELQEELAHGAVWVYSDPHLNAGLSFRRARYGHHFYWLVLTPFLHSDCERAVGTLHYLRSRERNVCVWMGVWV